MTTDPPPEFPGARREDSPSHPHIATTEIMGALFACLTVYTYSPFSPLQPIPVGTPAPSIERPLTSRSQSPSTPITSPSLSTSPTSRPPTPPLATSLSDPSRSVPIRRNSWRGTSSRVRTLSFQLDPRSDLAFARYHRLAGPAGQASRVGARQAQRKPRSLICSTRLFKHDAYRTNLTKHSRTVPSQRNSSSKASLLVSSFLISCAFHGTINAPHSLEEEAPPV